MKAIIGKVNFIFMAMQRHVSALLTSDTEINCTER